MSYSHCVSGAGAFTHDAVAQGTTERYGYRLLGTHSHKRVHHLYQCQSGDTQAGRNLRLTGHTCFCKQRQWIPIQRAGLPRFEQVYGFSSWAEDTPQSAMSQCGGRSVHEDTEEILSNKRADGIKPQAGNVPISTRLYSNSTLHHQGRSNWPHEPRRQVSYEATHRSHSSGTWLWRAVTERSWKENANEKLCGQQEVCQNLQHPDVGPQTGSQRGLTSIWNRTAVGEVPKGTRVAAERTDGTTITRFTAHFKEVPFRSADEAHQCSPTEWPTGLVSDSTF